jgi:hypothetical protein
VNTALVDLLLVCTLVVGNLVLLAVAVRQSTLLRRATDRAERAEGLLSYRQVRLPHAAAHRRTGVGVR